MSSSGLGKSLPRLSLERRTGVLVVVGAVLVMGLVAALSLPIELIPSGYSSPFLRVTVPWRDAPPQEVLDKITIPLEEELATVRGLENQYSFCAVGFTQVFLSFAHGTDMDVAYREVRDRIERARARMPDDVQQVFIRKDDDTMMPVAMVGLIVEEDTADVYNLIQNEVILKLERLPGVAAVDAQGLLEREVLIELDRQRVEAAGLNIFEIAQDLATDYFTLASGNVRAGDRKLLLRSVAGYPAPQNVRDMWVSDTVRLGDIASIRYDVPDDEFRVRVNGLPAYAIRVQKEGEANALDVASEVEALIEELARNPRLAALEVDTIMSSGEIIRDSMGVLLSSGRIGALFAMIVLFFFLRRLRMSLIIAFSIPLSMVVAVVAMYFFGETFNVISLLGLMISVGLLVDNSVVVAENIHRLHQSGVGRRQAALQGAGEIALAITTATLTTVIVFLPVSLVDGQGQFMLLRLVIPITVSLLASLVVALVVVPLAVYVTLPSQRTTDTGALRRVRDASNGVLRRAYEATFGLLNRGVRRHARLRPQASSRRRSAPRGGAGGDPVRRPGPPGGRRHVGRRPGVLQRRGPGCRATSPSTRRSSTSRGPKRSSRAFGKSSAWTISSCSTSAPGVRSRSHGGGCRIQAPRGDRAGHRADAGDAGGALPHRNGVRAGNDGQGA